MIEFLVHILVYMKAVNSHIHEFQAKFKNKNSNS